MRVHRPFPKNARWAVPAQVVLLGVLVVAGPRELKLAAQEADSPPVEDRFQKAIDGGQYALATKIAITQFRPDLHCRVYVEQAAAELRTVEAIAMASQRPEPAQLTRARQVLDQARTLNEQAGELADRYVQVGWEKASIEKVRSSIRRQSDELQTLSLALDRLTRQAKPLDALFAQPTLNEEDIQRLASESKLITGLHLADSGEIPRAIGEGFEPVQLEQVAALTPVAAAASELLGKWRAASANKGTWDNLINSKGLDVYETLRRERPDLSHLAGWYLALVAHAARDHHDVSALTIGDTVRLIEELKLPQPKQLHEKLLTAKLEHERFLLSRRSDIDTDLVAPTHNLELFEQSSAHGYAAEAALLAASLAAESSSADAFLERSERHIAAIASVNPQMADVLREHIRRFKTAAKPFAEWLELIMAPDLRDQRGTIWPDALIETRDQLGHRIRTGFEESIARSISAGQIDAAFQQAQRAKALTVGRTLAASPADPPAPISATELVATRLMSFGTDLANRVSRQELFIEYFFGPTRAWAFYFVAPGDTYEPLQVIELDRELIASRCKQTIQSLQADQPVGDVGEWLLAGTPKTTLGELWNRLGKIKKPDPQARRVVIAPDGPLCYVPLGAADVRPGSVVTLVPTAAVLKNADYLNVRDVRLMWRAQRRGFEEVVGAPPSTRVTRSGECQIILWPGARGSISVALRDTAGQR